MEESIVVTGGAGFIGTNSVLEFVKKGYDVTIFDNLSRPGVQRNLEYIFKICKDKVKFIWGDVRNIEDINKLPHSSKGILHCAANPGIPRSLGQPIYDFEVNMKGTLNILEFARAHGKVAVIFTSTNKVYPDTINDLFFLKESKHYTSTGKYINGLPENYPMDGVGAAHSCYGCSKAAADLYCQEYYHTFGVPTIINRMSCIYGPYQHGFVEQGWVVWFMIQKIKGRELTIFGDGYQTRDCLFGEDLAELYEIQLSHPEIFAGQIYNIGGGKDNSISLLEFIDYLDENYPQYPKLKIKFDKPRPADQKWCICDLKKIVSTGLWRPKTSLKEGFEKTFKWVERNIDELN